MRQYDLRRTDKVERLLERILNGKYPCKFDITKEEMYQLQDLNRTIQEAKSITRKRLVDAFGGGILALLIYGFVTWLKR